MVILNNLAAYTSLATKHIIRAKDCRAVDAD